MNSMVYHRYGGPEVLQAGTTQKPVPKANEVLIKIHFATTSVADCRVRSLDVPLAAKIPVRIMLGITRPKNTVLGAELAGTVEAVGSDVQRFQVGDEVFASALPTFGAYAEYICLAEDVAIAPKPANLTFEQAAALPIGARTALHFLRQANVNAGDRVLVYGASGCVGIYVIQLAKHWGAEVTAVCSGKNRELVLSQGADHVIDYTKEPLDARSVEYDVIYEAVNKSNFDDCVKILKSDGAYINIVRPLPSLKMVRARRNSNIRVLLGDRISETTADMVEVGRLAQAGIFTPVIDRCYPLAQVAEAHRYVETGRKRGNVVIDVLNNCN